MDNRASQQQSADADTNEQDYPTDERHTMNTCKPRLIAEETIDEEGKPTIHIDIDYTCHCGHCRPKPKKQTRSNAGRHQS